jgi:CDP-diacylglycerol--serine O-phosphatidyltransferase
MGLKLKDYVTLCNLLCGMGSIIALFNDRFDWACYLIVLGFFFDASDGLVARWTKQINKFGSELDGLCDMMSYGVAPTFLIYYAFRETAGYPLWAAVVIAGLPLAAGTVRAARYNVRRAEFPGFFIGLPRTSFSLVTVAVLNSSLFHVLGGVVSNHLYLIAVGVLMAASWLMVSTVPFVGHHGRQFKGWLRFGVWFFLLSVGASLLVQVLFVPDSSLVFDILLFDQLVYVLLAHAAVPKDEWAAVNAYVTEWKAMTGE